MRRQQKMSKSTVYSAVNLGLLGTSLASASDIVDVSGSTTGLVGHSHLVCEGAVWNPFGGLARSGLFQHLVDLLEGKTLGFWDEEVGEEESETTGRSPNEEDLGSEVTLVGVDNVWGNITDNEVPEPVGRSSNGNTLGTNWQWVDFSDKNPSTRTPGSSEAEDVDTDEND